MSRSGMPRPVEYANQPFPAFRWNQIICYTADVAGTAIQFNITDIWVHQTLVKADVNNTDAITFGPNSMADGALLTAGTEYLLPHIQGNLGGEWPRYNLKEWWVKSLSGGQKMVLWYV